MEDRLKRLEREALRTGDPTVWKDLARRLKDLGQPAPCQPSATDASKDKKCPKRLSKKKRRKTRSKDPWIAPMGATTSNRNQQRLKSHLDGKCGPKCRFCRKYGRDTRGGS